MNIAILIPTLCNGGAERVAAELSKYYSQKEHNVYIFTEQRDRKRYDFAGRFVTLHCFGGRYSEFGSWRGTMYGLLKRAAEVKRLKAHYHIDVSVSFMELYNTINILSRVNDKVVVRVCTVLSSYVYREKIYHPGLLRHLYNKADLVVAISHYGKADLIRHYGVKREKIKVIPNSVETSAEHRNGERWAYGEQAIICLARISQEKQQRLLVEVFARVKETIPGAKLILAGHCAGTYAEEVKRKAKELAVADDVIFTGHVDHVRYYLEHSKLFVLLSKVEGFGNATIEAMSAGIPVICMDSPGAAREILAPHTKRERLQQIDYAEYGVLVPFVDENDGYEEKEREKKLICHAITRIMRDAQLQSAYSKKSMARSAMFEIKRVGRLWDKILGEEDVRDTGRQYCRMGL